MENASRALLIAGSVLIGVIILSAAVFTYTNFTSLSREREQVLETEQLAKYNMQWESYNRNDLKGVDVISVYNKAMDTNEKYKYEGVTGDMITVFIKTKTTIQGYTETWTWNNVTNKYTKKETTQQPSSETLQANKIYRTDNSSDKSTLENFLSATDKSNGYTIETLSTPLTEVHKDYLKKYTSIATFKLLNFKCANTSDENKSGLVYDNYGRITQILLVEI